MKGAGRRVIIAVEDKKNKIQLRKYGRSYIDKFLNEITDDEYEIYKEEVKCSLSK